MFRDFSYLECSAFADYLHEMSLEGWHFTSWKFGLIFEKGEPNDAVELKIWREDTWFLDWCKTKPELSGENLTTYFYFTRTSLDEKISRISSFLSPVAQEILEQLLSKTDVKIKKALEAAVNISDAEAEAVLEAMYSSMSAETTISKETMQAFVEL